MRSKPEKHRHDWKDSSQVQESHRTRLERDVRGILGDLSALPEWEKEKYLENLIKKALVHPKEQREYDLEVLQQVARRGHLILELRRIADHLGLKGK